MAKRSGKNEVELGDNGNAKSGKEKLNEQKSSAKRASDVSLSTDSAILRKLRETEAEVQEGTRDVQLLKERIAELRDRIPVTEKDEKDIDRVQQLIRDKVGALELLMKRISMLLERSSAGGGAAGGAAAGRGAAGARAFAGACVKCGRDGEACVCGESNSRVCVCLPAKCVCRKAKAFVPGRWRGQQKDLFPVRKPRCVCVTDGEGKCACIGNLDEQCPCRQWLRDMPECECRREDHPAPRR